MGKMVRALLFAVMAVFSTAVFAEDEDPCAMPENLTEIEGVYQIGTCGDLYKFAAMVNGGETGINGRLTADICLNACGEGEFMTNVDGTLNGDGSNFTQWTPIGTSSIPYKGTFDGKDAEGNAHVISGLYFNDVNVDYVGLFGSIGENAKVQNVGVENSYLRGGDYVGSVVGFCESGEVDNVYNTDIVEGENYVGGVAGYIDAGVVSNAYNTGYVIVTWNYAGGVVGINYGTVSNVYNTGAVSGEMGCGGVVGGNAGTVSNVYNTAGLVGCLDLSNGGVVWDNSGTVRNAYYNNEVLAGVAIGRGTGEFENVKGKKVMEFAVLTFGTDGADFPLLEGETESPWAGDGIFYDKTAGILVASFPYLKNLSDFQYKINLLEFKVVDNVIQIANADELKDFARLVNEFGVTDVDAKLVADICLNACGEGESVLKADGTLNGNGSNFMQWTPIGTAEKPYAGTFDGMDAEGNAHVISGLYFNDEDADYVGLFGSIGENAQVQNVGVEDSYFRGGDYVGSVVGFCESGEVDNVYNTGIVEGENYVGGVVGNNDGTVSNVYNIGAVSGDRFVGGVVGFDYSVTISNVYNTGAVSGVDYVGGVVGSNAGGTISNVYNTGAVSGEGRVDGASGDRVGGVVGSNQRGTISNVYNTGAVGGTTEVGGVVGINDGTVSNGYNTGAVSGWEEVGGVVGINDGTVSNVYNIGAVSSEDRFVGGVVGLNAHGTVSNVYNTGAVSGEDNVGGVVGENWSSVSNGYYNTDMPCENCGSPIEGTNGKTTAELATLDVSNAFDDSEGVWIAGGKSLSGGWLTYTFPSLKNVGTALKNVLLDPGASEVEISNAEELFRFAEFVNGGETSINAKLTADICVNACDEGERVLNDDGTLNEADTSKFVKWTPIGTNEKPYTGTFDGNGKSISGLYFNDESGFGGLFGILEEATVKNVGVVDSYFSGQSAIGAIAGLVADGEVSNVYSESAVSGGEYVGGVVGVNVGIISGSYNKGSVNGYEKVGGIVGADVGKITDCYNMGFVKGFLDIGGVAGLVEGGGEVDKVYNVGAVSGEEFLAGGLIGSIDEGSLKIGYNTGAVSGKNSVGGVVGGSADASIDNVYNTGAVSGENAIGGIVGGNEGGIISNVLNMGSVMGTKDVGGIVGGMGNNSISNCYFDKTIFDGNAIGEKYGEEIDESNFGKTSTELVAGAILKLDTAVWVLGGVGVGTTNDSLYYPYLKVFGPHEYVLSDVKKYAITVAVNDKAMGSVTGAGEYEYGTKVEIKAVANEGYKFTDWEDDVKTAARTITVTKAETYTANFEAISSSSSEVESSSSVAESSSSVDESSSSEAVSSSSDAKSSSSQKESIIAQAQLPQFSVTASGKMVSIAGVRPNTIVNVFDMQGNMVKTIVATSANFTFALPSAGVYIVKNGYTAKRVNVR